MISIFDTPEFNGNLFFPRPDYGSRPPESDDLFVVVEGEIRVHLRRHRNPSAGLTVLYFHGNGEIVADYDDLAGNFVDLGAELIVADYRGYGKSTGRPTLRSALLDASIIYGYLRKEKFIKDKLCVMGRSLGSAPAIELCARFPEVDACIIESGYADPIPLVERRGLRIDSTTPAEDAMFNNSQKIKRVNCPLLVMHGKNDNLIYPREAEMNHNAAGSSVKRLRLFEGVGHNDILMAPDYFSCLRGFLEETLGL